MFSNFAEHQNHLYCVRAEIRETKYRKFIFEKKKLISFFIAQNFLFNVLRISLKAIFAVKGVKTLLCRIFFFLRALIELKVKVKQAMQSA